MFYSYNTSRTTYIKTVIDNQVEVCTGRNGQDFGQDFNFFRTS